MRGVATAAAARWDAAHGVFVYEGRELPAALVPFRAAPYSWEMQVERELAEAGAPPVAAPRGAVELRPHQVAAVRAIAAARKTKLPGFLLADDVGLGKTISAWAAILEMRDVASVLIVCPLSVVSHWRRTIEAMGDRGKRVVVLNYDRLGKLFEISEAARKKVRTKKGLARAGTAPELDVIVLDESHRCKNPGAARSKLAAKLVANAGFTLWLSATAGQNPLELSYLAPLLAAVTGARAKDLKDFEQWCLDQDLGVTRGGFGKWMWRGDRADCEKVRRLLFDGAAASSPAGLRRRPEDIAGWPAINRILMPIELTAEARALYGEAWTAFRRELDLAPRGTNPKSVLAAILRLRQKSSLVRAAGTLELARELLDNGHRVAISVAFIETLTSLRETLEAGVGAVPCAAIHGALSPAHREAERLRFQHGQARVMLFTVEEGISLHQGEHGGDADAPRSQIIHDLRWSAIQMAQIEGRCHRDGRFAPVYWTYADDTVEEHIARVVAGRIQSMKEMIGDDVDTLRAIEDLLRADRA
ncbi:MAG: DEAD/DEAH box helicase [Deltaproteobacteria bacterium]|nr:DEAD/DEAH box helicase [Deltaproteobacteria bacterium]